MVILQTKKQLMDDIFDWLTRKDYKWYSGHPPYQYRNYLNVMNYKTKDWDIDKNYALILDNKSRVLSFGSVGGLTSEHGIRMTDKQFLENLIDDMIIVNKGEMWLCILKCQI